MNSRVAVIAVMLLAGCGQTDPTVETQNSDQSQAAPATDAGSTLAARLTPGYLAGDWCNSHIVAGQERSDEMISYTFLADGTLFYQNNPQTAVDRPGSFTIGSGHLKILPALQFFDFTPEQIEPDAMVRCCQSNRNSSPIDEAVA